MAPRTHLWQLARQWLRPIPIPKALAPMIRRVPGTGGKIAEEMGKGVEGFVEGGVAGRMMDVVRNVGIRITDTPLMGMFLFVFRNPPHTSVESCTMIIEANAENRKKTIVVVVGTKTTA